MVFGQGGLSGIHRRGRTFCGLGLQGKPDGYSLSNIFEGSFTEEGMGAVRGFFEEGLKISASEERKKFASTDSAYRGEIGEQSGISF